MIFHDFPKDLVSHSRKKVETLTSVPKAYYYPIEYYVPQDEKIQS